MTSNHHPVSTDINLDAPLHRRNTSGLQAPAVDRMNASGPNPKDSVSELRPFIIPVFLPHAGCPHQCVFCNQVSITGVGRRSINPENLRTRIQQFLAFKKKNRSFVEIAFYGGNFLGLQKEEIRSALTTAGEFIGAGQVDGIRFSTRPDTVDAQSLDMIERYPVSTVELGAQSMDDRVLALNQRGHRASDTVRAVARLRERHFTVGIQMMVGLPGDDAAGALTTTRKIIDSYPDFVRIYPTVVVADSRLAGWYRRGDYTPLSLDDAVDLVKKIYLKYKAAGIGVVRMGLQASEDLAVGTTVLAGPHHPAFGHMVHSEIFFDLAESALRAAGSRKDTCTIYVHPRSISKMRGLKNSNIERLSKQFGMADIHVIADSAVNEGGLRLD